MADNKNKYFPEAEEVNENFTGQTGFGSGKRGMGGMENYPVGNTGRFFSRFFSNQAAPFVAQTQKDVDGKEHLPQPGDSGDAVVNHHIIGAAKKSYYDRLDTPIEQSRKYRYADFEVMDDYPEIGATFDTYADDCTQETLQGERWTILSDDPAAREEAMDCLDRIRLENFVWDISRNTCKYGDCFIELVVDLNNPKRGLHSIKILNPNFLLRSENEYSRLEGFFQQIPQEGDFQNYGQSSDWMKDSIYIPLDKFQVVHFRLHTADHNYYPYGKSLGASVRSTFRSLKMMEDAMLIYRLARAPERRVFYIDVGNISPTKAEAAMERMKSKLKKEKYYDKNRNSIDARFNPQAPDEDFFIPVNSKSNTKIDTLKGAENLGEVDDVKYFRDKLLSAMRIPKDYVVEKDNSPERKANLSQLDAKFARVVMRVQQSVELGLNSIVQRHLLLRGFPRHIAKKVKVKLPSPSDLFLKRRLDVYEQQVRTGQGLMEIGLFSKRFVLENVFELSEDEIKELEKEVDEDKKKALEEQVEEQEAMMPPDPMGGMGAPGEAPMPMDQSMQNPSAMSNPAEFSNDFEGAENTQPTANETRLVYAKLLEKYERTGKTELAENVKKILYN